MALIHRWLRGVSSSNTLYSNSVPLVDLEEAVDDTPDESLGTSPQYQGASRWAALLNDWPRDVILSIQQNGVVHTKLTLRILKCMSFFLCGFAFANFTIPLWGLQNNVPDPFDEAFSHFQKPLPIAPAELDYPVEFLRSVLPIPCHSHNDYWRRRPLFSALGTGCTSVEADVWRFTDRLYVGHTDGELTQSRTLKSLYVDPLVALLERINKVDQVRRPRALVPQPSGVFFQDPVQTLVLVIDFKQKDLWQYVVEELEPLRERGYLTHWNGQERIMRPVTIVASGSAPFDEIVRNTTYRDIFYDAPLERIDEALYTVEEEEDDQQKDIGFGPFFPHKYNPSNSYYASASLVRALGTIPGLLLSEPQIQLLRVQIARAREQGLISRYWGAPRWPRGLRNHIWSVLIREHVGVLNVDDLRAARKGEWFR